MPRYEGEGRSKFRMDTSRGVHIRALHALLCDYLSDAIATGPRAGGAVALRDHIGALERAYPRELGLTESDVAQAVAEADGIPQDY